MGTEAGRLALERLDKSLDRAHARREEFKTFRKTPTWGAIKYGVPRAFSATAESLPSFMGGVMSRTPGLLPRKIDLPGWVAGTPVGVGLGPGYVPEVTIGKDRHVPLIPKAGEAMGLLSRAPGMGAFGEPKPEAMEAFKTFVTPGREGLGLGETLRDVQRVQEARPMLEQIGLGLIDPVGTLATGGLGATKAIPAAMRGVPKLAGRIPGLFGRLRPPIPPTPIPLGAIPTRTSRLWDEATARAAPTPTEAVTPVTRPPTPATYQDPQFQEMADAFRQRQAMEAFARPTVAPGAEVARAAPTPTRTTPLWRGEELPPIPPVRTRLGGTLPRTSRLWDEGAGVPTPEPLETTPQAMGSIWRAGPFWRGQQPPRWTQEVQDIPYAQQAGPLWREGARAPTIPTRTTPLWRGEELPPIPPMMARLGGTLPRTSRLWDEAARGPAMEPLGTTPTQIGRFWEEGVPPTPTMEPLGTTPSRTTPLWREGGATPRMTPEEMMAAGYEYDIFTGAPLDRAIGREGGRLATNRLWRGEEIPGGPTGDVEGLPYALGANRLWAEGSRRANQLDEMDAVIRTQRQEPDVAGAPEVIEAGRRGPGAQPEMVQPIREQVAEAVRGWPAGISGAAARLAGRGPAVGVEASERTAEVTGSWVARYGNEEDIDVVHKLTDVLKTAGRVREEEIKTAVASERSERLAAGLSAAKGLRGSEAMKAFASVQAGDVISARRTLNVDDILEGVGGQRGVNRLMDMMDEVGAIGGDTPKERLLPWQQFNAQNALNDLLNQGAVPTSSNLNLLADVFGEGVGGALVRRRPVSLWEGGPLGRMLTERTGYKPSELLLDILNMPRANVSSVDLSFLLRQGGMLFPSQLKEVRASTDLALRAMAPGGEQVALGVMTDMRNVENGQLWMRYVDGGGLFMHDVAGGVGGRAIGSREEAFISTLAGKVFPWVRPSERAYGTFLNKMRWDVMDEMIKKYETARGGRIIDPKNSSDLQMLKDTARYINTVTGRGPLGTNAGWMRGAATLMNALMFSPRLFTSRFAAPVQAMKMVVAPGDRANIQPGIRALFKRAVEGDEEALAAYKTMSWTVARQMITWFGTGVGILTAAKMAQEGGLPVSVGANWRSSDFGKVQVGSVRYDIWSGYSQIARAIGQLKEKESKSASTGTVYEQSVGETLKRFVRTKFNPAVSIFQEYNLIPGTRVGEGGFMHGQGFLGEDRDLLEDMKTSPIRLERGVPLLDEESFWTNVMGPLFLRDLSDAIDDEISPLVPREAVTQVNIGKEPPSLVWGVVRGVLRGAPSAVGIGVTAFRTRDDMAREVSKDEPRGPREYNLLPEHQKQMVDDLIKLKDLERGRKRTRGMMAELEGNRQQEQNAYRRLAQKVSTTRVSVSDVREDFYNIQQEVDARRQDIFEKHIGGVTERGKELRREGMGPLERRIQAFYDMLDQAQIKKGTELLPAKLLPKEYIQVLDAWESEMVASDEPDDRAAVLWKRMNMYREDIPEEILKYLSVGVRQRYEAARKMREWYDAGELREELYQQR